MDALETILTRASPRKMSDPGPNDQDLRAMLMAACRAPDHGRLRPWHFVTIQGDARFRFAEVLSSSLQARSPSVSEAQLDRERAKALRAPLIVTAAAVPSQGKIPEIEQIAAVAAAVQNLVLAAHALGYGAFWRTGAPAYDPAVASALGLPETATIVGFVYIGTIVEPGANVAPVLEGRVEDWSGSSPRPS